MRGRTALAYRESVSSCIVCIFTGVLIIIIISSRRRYFSWPWKKISYVFYTIYTIFVVCCSLSLWILLCFFLSGQDHIFKHVDITLSGSLNYTS